MPTAAHLLRRNGVYYWRRKMPKALVACQNRAHVLISLRTFNPKQASSLAAQLDALLDDLTTMPDARLLTQPQLDGMLRDVLMHHLAKLERVAAVEKLERGFDRSRAERDDLRTAWVYRLLESKGPSAQVSNDDREVDPCRRLRREGDRIHRRAPEPPSGQRIGPDQAPHSPPLAGGAERRAHRRQ